MISGLGKRVFLYHSIYKSAPVLFGTRWTMNFLAGPLTRTQIPALLKLTGASISRHPSPPLLQPRQQPQVQLPQQLLFQQSRLASAPAGRQYPAPLPSISCPTIWESVKQLPLPISRVLPRFPAWLSCCPSRTGRGTVYITSVQS